MLKLTSLVVGLLTVISLAPSAQAFPIQSNSSDLYRRDASVRPQLPQINVTINPQLQREQEYRRQAELNREREVKARLAAERYRQAELAREREVRVRLAAERRRQQQYAQRHGNSHSTYRDRRDIRSGSYYGH